MTTYSCTLCGDPLADTSMNSAELSNEIYEISIRYIEILMQYRSSEATYGHRIDPLPVT
jgi:hypothetical protein